MKRRTVLASCSTALAAAIAGCGGGGGSGSDGSDGSSGGTATPTESGMSTPTQTEMSTPTESGMSTPTQTEMSTPTPQSGFTHEVGERFTVGEGSNAIRYRIEGIYRADQIGSQIDFEEPDNGTFLIVVLTLNNPQTTETAFPEKDFRVIDSGGTWSTTDSEANNKVDPEDRIGYKSIGDATVSGGNSQTGVVVFDVSSSKSYRLWITPTNDSSDEEHFIQIGQASSVQELPPAGIGG